MTKNKHVPVVVGVVIGLAALGAVAYGTQRIQAVGTDQSTMIQSLAQKLGLSEDKVDEALTSVRTERQESRQQEMQQRFEESLTQAVTDGKITDAQKKLILDKHTELQKERESEFSERQAERQSHRDEIEKWASDNGIDLSVLPTMLGGMGGRGMGMDSRGGMRGGMGMMRDVE